MVAPASGGGADELPIDVDLIKVLASDSRRDILRLLGERRRTLTELSEALGLKKATVLEHLKKLVESGLIRRLDEDDRLWIYYELTPRGLRLVRPGRTRFYLIMAGAAVAAVVLGAVLVVALSNGFGGDDVPTRSPTEEAMLDGRATGAVPEVVWRGLDADVPIRITDPARANGTLLLTATGGAASQLALPVEDGAATLRAVQLDALAPATYMMTLRVGDLEAALPQAVVVRDPAIAVYPRAVVANETTRLVLSLPAEGARGPPTPTVTLDGASLPLGGAPPQHTIQLPPQPIGTAELHVGRLVRIPITVLPDLALAARIVNESLEVRVFDARGPVDANVSLAGAPLGATTNGTLRAPAPADGEWLLEARAPDGRHAERAIAVRGTEAVFPPPRLTLSAFLGVGSPGATRVHAEVQNGALAGETVTVALRDARGLLASGVVDVPAGGTAPLVIETPTASVGTLVVEAFAADEERHAARWIADAEWSGAPATATPTAVPTTTAPAASPTATTPVPTSTSRPYADRAPDASVTLVTATPTTSPHAGATQEPQVPGPSVALVLAAALAVAMLARRRGAEK